MDRTMAKEPVWNFIDAGPILLWHNGRLSEWPISARDLQNYDVFL